MKIVFTDLDGTLLDNERAMSSRNRKTLLKLAEEGITRVLVTGRSLYSARKQLGDDFPIDYLIFSTGAGIMEWRSKKIINKLNIPEDSVKACSEILLSEETNFMLHREIPESHFFYYYPGDHTPDDFQLRIDIYNGFAEPYDIRTHKRQAATQFLSILSPRRFDKVYRKLTESNLELSFIKTTSPLLNSSMWLEIYTPGVSKGHAADYLANMLAVPVGNCLAVGNDYNDLAMLEWSGSSYVVDNAPEQLREKYNTVSSNIEDGFTEAVRRWLNQ